MSESEDRPDHVCIVCGKQAGREDLCTDGNYLHRECAYATSLKKGKWEK